MKTVQVALSLRPYDIVIGNGLLSEVGRYWQGWTDGAKHAAVVTDDVVDGLYAEQVAEILAESGVRTDVCVVESGEESKCVETAEMLWQKLMECDTDRKSVVVAVGGGVVGDLAGFVAATLNRGLRFMQIPTTLLAQVDSSVGGKVGINLPQGKNLVGAFWQPIGVLADTDSLRTLDERQYKAGLGEVVKYGVSLDREFFEFLEANVASILDREATVLTEIIARCCALKAGIVLEDERETLGKRALLNYGHTFGHAVEKLCGFGTVLHGEAVGMGMTFAAELAMRLSPGNARLEELFVRQQALLKRLGIPHEAPLLEANEAIAAMRHDKKAEHGSLRFVLPTRLGEVELQTVENLETVSIGMF
ncbi:MAG: 3-dehydroquinate synthase [Planctomycetia bacterium]|nr:3-dehydroquinate synthase [Planctomycetia bacterium]